MLLLTYFTAIYLIPIHKYHSFLSLSIVLKACYPLSSLDNVWPTRSGRWLHRGCHEKPAVGASLLCGSLHPSSSIQRSGMRFAAVSIWTVWESDHVISRVDNSCLRVLVQLLYYCINLYVCNDWVTEVTRGWELIFSSRSWWSRLHTLVCPQCVPLFCIDWRVF